MNTMDVLVQLKYTGQACERKINWTKDISGGHKGFGKLGTSLILDISIFFGG